MRLIDGNALMDLYANRLELLGERYGYDSSECGVLAGAMKLLKVHPTIEERKRRKWIYPYGTTRLVAICSECGSHGSGNFCANCGSYNKGE